jgi:hypothetical protein
MSHGYSTSSLKNKIYNSVRVKWILQF